MKFILYRVRSSYLLLGFILTISSCKKFVEIPPPQTQLVSASVFSSDAGTMAALSAIYVKMAYFEDNADLSLLPGLSSDELINYSTDKRHVQISTNSLTADNSFTQNIWTAGYNYIYQANAILEGASASTTISSSVKQQVIGEAEFIRSYWYFYLVNLFGDVPMITSTLYQKNAIASRTSGAAVYQKIVADLKDAQIKLNSNFVESDGITSKPTTERLRPTKAAASALLARVYLYLQDWVDAETQASIVINNVATFNLLNNLNSVFLKNNREAILQFSAGPSTNTFEGGDFILIFGPPSVYQPGALSTQQLNAFEPGDARRINWVDSAIYGGVTYYYPYKYKVGYSTTVTEFEVVLRLAEQYLIRAEARLKQGNLAGAQTDLNAIRSRAGLPNTSTNTLPTLLSAILHERQVELFTEFGHRWLDLKRTGNIDGVMGAPGGVCAAKGGSWNTNQQLYPIPVSEIQTDNKLVQNPGY